MTTGGAGAIGSKVQTQRALPPPNARGERFYLKQCVTGCWVRLEHCADVLNVPVKLDANFDAVNDSDYIKSPPEFATYMNYCQDLEYEEKPDYNMLRNLVISVAKRERIGL